MNQPYNRDGKEVLSTGNVGKLGLLFLMTTIAVVGISCRNAAPVGEEPTAVRPVAEAIAEAEQFYAGRADLVKIRQGLVVLRQAQAQEQGNYELAWRLAKFNYYLGAHTPESAERDKAFHDGIEAGKLAVKVQDGQPDGHFWLGANYGGSAKASMLSGLTEFDDIKREMETVLKLNEGYQSGSAYMVLGQLYLEAPGFLGGDTQKAIQNLEKGLRLGPDNALLRVRLAEAYAEANRNEDARKQIDALLAMKPAPGFEPEHDEAVVQVRKLQEKIK
jgi:tetratricopeptide (TPR) repeat protein